MKLAKREKLVIIAAVCILGIFLIINRILFPYLDKKDYLKKNAEEIERSIRDLDIIGAEGRNIDNISGDTKNALKEPIYTFINKAAVAVGIEPKLNPSMGKELDGVIEDKCSVDLTSITFPQLKDFLLGIEKHEKNIFINSITVNHSKKEEGYLDASIKVIAYKIVTPEK